MFPSQRQSKLNSKEDGPLQVIKGINDNYKPNDYHEYGVNPTFNICDLHPFTEIVDFEDDIDMMIDLPE